MKPPRARQACMLVSLSFISLCLLATAASGLSNVGLPQRSTSIERLSDLEKARLSEVLHLRNTLGDAVWPGWSRADIPLMVYNEKYAFLVGYPNPPAGWLKVPAMEARGGAWEEVPADRFEGQPYYRTPITDPEKTPEGFTVLVGNRWVATFQTREYGEVEFYRGLRAELPPLVSYVVPVRLAWELLMGQSESYIAALEHESFHANQGTLAAARLAAAESLYAVEEGYPFDAMEGPWKQEMSVLVQAAESADIDEARTLVREFLRLRKERRASLSAEQVDLERAREWEEGLAKYAELEISRRAGTQTGYRPVDGMVQDPDFKNYTGREQFWHEQLQEAKYTQARPGDTRFYYSGNAMAIVLDHLLPGWKPRALPGGEYLDSLLEQAVK